VGIPYLDAMSPWLDSEDLSFKQSEEKKRYITEKKLEVVTSVKASTGPSRYFNAAAYTGQFGSWGRGISM